jgi:hypothetical protein
MIQSLIIGIGGVVSLMILWMIIQFWWGKTFSDNISDEDVLAGRTSCSNCGCTTVCEKRVEKVN